MVCDVAGKVALTTNQNYVRDFTVAYDILYENISDQVSCWRLPACWHLWVKLAMLSGHMLSFSEKNSYVLDLITH